MEKILTIVIPTYNMQDYLRRCLDSLIVPEEQMKQLEVLVVNDGSKDNSSAIAHEYQDKYPDTFRLIDKENGNYGSCVNRGLREATGKYIKILDADDSFHNSNFRGYVDFLLQQNTDMVVNDYCIVDGKGNISSIKRYHIPENATEFNEQIRKIFNKKNFQMHAVAYKRDKLVAFGYQQTEGISYTDQEWIYTPLMTIQTISYFNKVLYKYLVGRSGQTMSPEILKKSVSQNQKCIVRILRDYSNMPALKNLALKEYLKDQAIVSLQTIYSSYLLFYRELDLEGLSCFDKELKAISLSMFSQSDSIRIPHTTYSYIKYWHRHHRRPNSLWFQINLLYYKIYDKFLRELSKY